MSTLQNIVEADQQKNSYSTYTSPYNGLFINGSSSNVAKMTSLNLSEFDMLRCELEAKGIDHYGSQLLAKEFLKLVKAGTFTFNDILSTIRRSGVNQEYLRFTQLYLDALNSERTSSSNLSLIGTTPIPENVARAIIF